MTMARDFDLYVAIKGSGTQSNLWHQAGGTGINYGTSSANPFTLRESATNYVYNFVAPGGSGSVYRPVDSFYAALTSTVQSGTSY